MEEEGGKGIGFSLSQNFYIATASRLQSHWYTLAVKRKVLYHLFLFIFLFSFSALLLFSGAQKLFQTADNGNSQEQNTVSKVVQRV